MLSQLSQGCLSRRPDLFYAELGNQLAQIGMQTGQGPSIETLQSIRQQACERPMRVCQQGMAFRRGMEMHNPAVVLVTCAADQAFFHQRPHQVAGSGLVDVHGVGQCPDLGAGMARHDAQRPQLRTAQTRLGLDTLEVRFDGVEHHTKLPQDNGSLRGERHRIGLGI